MSEYWFTIANSCPSPNSDALHTWHNTQLRPPTYMKSTRIWRPTYFWARSRHYRYYCRPFRMCIVRQNANISSCQVTIGILTPSPWWSSVSHVCRMSEYKTKPSNNTWKVRHPHRHRHHPRHSCGVWHAAHLSPRMMHYISCRMSE